MGLILILPLSIFVTSFSNNEKPGFRLLICSILEYPESNFRIANPYAYEKPTKKQPVINHLLSARCGLSLAANKDKLWNQTAVILRLLGASLKVLVYLEDTMCPSGEQLESESKGYKSSCDAKGVASLHGSERWPGLPTWSSSTEDTLRQLSADATTHSSPISHCPIQSLLLPSNPR